MNYKNYEYDRNKIIDRVKSLRGKRGTDGYVSNEVIANIVGYSTKQVNSWFNKEQTTDIPLPCLIEISNLLKCDVDYLLGRIDQKTKEVTDICDATSLSEEAVSFLCSKQLTAKATATMVSFLIEEEKESEEESLVSAMLSYFVDEVNMFWVSKNEWFPLFDKVFNRVAPNFEEEHHFVDFDDYYQDAVETFVQELRKDNYSEAEIDEIRHSVEKMFRAYYLRLEYRKLNQVRLQSKILKSMDTLVSMNAKNQEERKKNA